MGGLCGVPEGGRIGAVEGLCGMPEGDRMGMTEDCVGCWKVRNGL